MLAGEVGTGAGHSALDLIGDIHNAIRVAPVHESLQVSLGGNDEASLALNGFHHEAGDLGCAHALLEEGNGPLGCFRPGETVVEG